MKSEGDLAAAQWLASVGTFVSVLRYPKGIVESWLCSGSASPVGRGATAHCVCGLEFSVPLRVIPLHAKRPEQLKKEIDDEQV